LTKPEFHLAGKIYTVKAQIKANVRHIVTEAALNTPLTGKYFDFMRDLFSYHPRAELKIGPGIETIVVRVSSRHSNNREFWIKQRGGEEFIDISWTECLKATPALVEFRNACRLAVKATTQAFCDAEFAKSAERELLRCPIAGNDFSREEAHVDHDDPWPFRRIVDEFIKREGIDVHKVDYDGFEHGSTFITLRDPRLADKFVRFHNDVARLRVVSRSGNLGRSRTDDEAAS
jgi:hypothetical protein